LPGVMPAGAAQSDSPGMTWHTLPADLRVLAAPHFYEKLPDGTLHQVAIPEAGKGYYVTTLVQNLGPGTAGRVEVEFLAETPNSEVHGSYSPGILAPGQTVLVSSWLATTKATQNVAIYVKPSQVAPDPNLFNNGTLVVLQHFGGELDFTWLVVLLIALVFAGLVYVGVLRLLAGGRRI